MCSLVKAAALQDTSLGSCLLFLSHLEQKAYTESVAYWLRTRFIQAFHFNIILINRDVLEGGAPTLLHTRVSALKLLTQELKDAKLPVLTEALNTLFIMCYAARIIHYIFFSYDLSGDLLRTAGTKTDKRLHEYCF